MRFFSGTEGISRGKEALGDGVFSTIINELNERQRLGGFNQNQIKEIL